MKLLRVGPSGAERPATLTGDGRLLDLTGVVDDITGATLARPELDRMAAAVDGGGLPVLEADGLRIGPSLARPGVVRIGSGDSRA